MTKARHIASFNQGRLIADWDDPAVAEFTEALDRVNALAERSPGYVWRMDDIEEQAEAAFPGQTDPRTAATLAVWETYEDLSHFVHQTLHGRFLARRLTWFEPAAGPSHVMWFVPAGHRPTIVEAAGRMMHLASEGASPDAFDWTWAAEHIASAPAA